MPQTFSDQDTCPLCGAEWWTPIEEWGINRSSRKCAEGDTFAFLDGELIGPQTVLYQRLPRPGE